MANQAHFTVVTPQTSELLGLIHLRSELDEMVDKGWVVKHADGTYDVTAAGMACALGTEEVE